MSRARTIAALCSSLWVAACCENDRQRWEYTSPSGGWGGSAGRAGGTGASTTPTLVVDGPSFPPIGPGNPLVLKMTDAGSDLSSVEVSFREKQVFTLSGGTATFQVPLAQIGDGRGTLSVRVRDARGASASWSRSGTVVDLRAPTVIPPSGDVARAGEPLAIWIADDWALGSYEITVDDWSETKTFPKAWPATAGKDWDEAMILVPGLVGDGWHQIDVTATDAAGNVEKRVVHVDVDAQPPKAKVLLPLPGAKLSSASKILLAAEDDRDAPVKLDVRLGGVPIASALGPSAEVGVDVDGFVKGPTELVVTPVDGAGNVGDPVVVSVVLE